MSEAQNNVVSMEDRKRTAPKWGKQQILANVGKVEDEYFPEAQATISIRRLGSGEWAEVEALQASGITLEGEPDADMDPNDPAAAKNNAGLKMKIDVEETTRGEARSRHQAVAYALSVNGEHWSPEEVAAIPNIALIRAINTRALRLSGVSAEAQAEIRNFREQRGGGESGVADDEGDAVSPDDSDADTGTGDVPDGGASEGGSES